MTARTTYTGAVQTAATAQLVTVNAAETTRQETINQSGCNVGYNLQTGNYGELFCRSEGSKPCEACCTQCG